MINPNWKEIGTKITVVADGTHIGTMDGMKIELDKESYEEMKSRQITITATIEE